MDGSRWAAAAVWAAAAALGLSGLRSDSAAVTLIALGAAVGAAVLPVLARHASGVPRPDGRLGAPPSRPLDPAGWAPSATSDPSLAVRSQGAPPSVTDPAPETRPGAMAPPGSVSQPGAAGPAAAAGGPASRWLLVVGSDAQDHSTPDAAGPLVRAVRADAGEGTAVVPIGRAVRADAAEGIAVVGSGPVAAAVFTALVDALRAAVGTSAEAVEVRVHEDSARGIGIALVVPWSAAPCAGVFLVPDESRLPRRTGSVLTVSEAGVAIRAGPGAPTTSILPVLPSLTSVEASPTTW